MGKENGAVLETFFGAGNNIPLPVGVPLPWLTETPPLSG